tara:strand:- start:118 stop:309 length:192 start_codon:yes stop_codon:yes gene_type:complete
MSRVSEAIESTISILEHIGYNQEDAINLVQNDYKQAKKEIDDYWNWVDDRVDEYSSMTIKEMI